MSTLITISATTRSQIPLLAGFDTEDGCAVELDRPLVNEVSVGVDPTTLSDKDLLAAIITAAYIGVSSREFVDELIWREGESQSLWINNHVNPLIEKGIYNEIAALYPGEQDSITRCDRKVEHKCNELAERGALRMLKWARENGCPWNEWTCSGAAENGHLEVLKYLHENGCPWDSETCRSAAENGHLETLKYLHENGCPWDSETCRSAAENGHLEVLKYAHENGCPWDVYTSHIAAYNGHLETLKYAHENDCPWNSDTCNNAAKNGHLETLK